MMDNSKRTFILICAVLAAVIIAYEPIRLNGFVNFDDLVYISDNPHVNKGFTIDSVKWAFAVTGYQGNWHPVTWLSHMFDCQLFGLNPAYHHIHNVILHAASALLLLWLLARTTKSFWTSAFIAALFALHPLRVESVAWASERKDVLCIFFFMLTLLSYSFYCQKKNVYRYLTTVLFYALGLMSKPTIVTLPFVLLLFDYWPLQRFSISDGFKKIDIKLFGRLIIEKIPFFVLAVCSSVITYIVQHWDGIPKNAVSPHSYVRFLNAFISYFQYISKTVYPVKLAAFYPHPTQNISVFFAIICMIGIAGFSIYAVYSIAKKPYLFTGWFFYLGTLIPTIGFVQVGGQAFADRYSYIPTIGLYIIAAYGAKSLPLKPNFKKILFPAISMIILAAIIIITRNQVKVWKDSYSLYEHAVKVTSDNFSMLANLSQEMMDRGQSEDALKTAEKAVDISPYYPEGVTAKARALFELNRIDELLAFLKNYDPNKTYNSETYNYLAIAYASKNDFNSAMPMCLKAIELDQRNFKAVYNLGLLMDKSGDKENAILCWQRAIRINPAYSMPYFNLGYAYMEQKNYDKAIEHFEKSLSFKPNQPQVLAVLAAACAGSGNFEKAEENAQKALETAVSQNKSELADKIKSDLELYRQNKSPDK